MIRFSWHPLDTVVVTTLIFLFISIIFLASKKSHSSKSQIDFFLMGRKLTLPLFVATLVSTWYGGIFGVTQIIAEKGLYGWISQSVFWYLAYYIFAIFLVKKIQPLKLMSLPDVIKKNVGPKSAKIAAYFNLIDIIPVTYVISLGLFIQIVLPMNFTTAMLIGVFIVSSYSCIGGFRTIIYTDLLQFILMMSGVLIVAFFSIKEIQSLNHLQESLPKGHLSLLGKESLGTLVAWGCIAFSTLVDPHFYQRIFAANSLKTAKRGILYSTLFWIIFDLSILIGVLQAKSQYPSVPNQHVYFFYALKTLPSGLKGIFLFGVLSTILSTMDSSLFLGAQTWTLDLKKWKNHSMKKKHFLSTWLVGGWAFCLAVLFDGNIKRVWKTLGSLSAASILIPMIFILFSKKKVSDNGLTLTFIVSSLSILLWKGVLKNPFNIDELYVGALVSILFITFDVIIKREPSKTALSSS